MKNKIIAFLIVTPIAIAIGAYRLVHIVSDRHAKQTHTAYQGQLQALSAAGIPTQMAKLQDPLPPAARDAGPIFAQIDAELKAHPPTAGDKILVDGFKRHMPSPQEIADAHAAVIHQAHLLSLIHAAAARPQCDLRINWSNPDPVAVVFPRFAGIRQSTRVISVESFDLAHQGHFHEAIQNQALGFQLADHALSGKTTIAYLVALACNAITLEGMRKILYLSHGDPVAAQEIIDAIDSRYHPVKYSKALQTEITFDATEIEYLRSAGPLALFNSVDNPSHKKPEQVAMTTMGKAQWNTYLDDNGALILTTLRHNHDIADLPYPQSNPQLAASDAALDKASNSYSGRFRYMLTEVCLPPSRTSAAKKTTIDADARIVEISARLLIQKSKTHAFPTDLSALPHLPLDPFTEGPFHYRREGDGFVLYSTGEDGNFDGGTPARKPEKYQSMFRYPIPPYYTNPVTTP
ncbi:hypothetical protein CCAX7_39300 [Capsulimonas corticalis]|uniref:Uncharacterized protein n=1 Tax=Capsulimonas corticalis TaxID=2219043 RepID=A0A402D3N0_9BACT|nr:hypothetical protein [Capsulimonas corticalis]BDI31879.1 hypothetical protein CCAX7_39300 [Capsulimonas corticalis]